MSEREQRILHVLSGDLWGGKEAQILLQQTALQRQGWISRIILFNDGNVRARYEAAGLSCKVLSEDSGLLPLARALLRTVREERPNLLISHGYKEACLTALASLLSGTPWISTFHGLTEARRGIPGLKLAAYEFVQRFSARVTAHRIIAVSEALARDLGFARLKKTCVVRNVTESNITPRGRSSELRVENLFAEGTPAVICIGRLVPVKRLTLAIRAFKLLIPSNDPSPHLYIVGDGPEKDSLEGIASSNPCIHFLGFRSDARELISSADVLLLTSISEGIPTVLLEAIASCIPVVSTSIGGIPEVFSLLPGYPAFLVKAATPENLARALSEALKVNRIDIQEEKIRNTFEAHFIPEVAAAKLARIYSETAHQGNVEK